MLRLGVGPLGVSWGAVSTTVVPGGGLEEALGQNSSVIPLPQQYTLLSPCSRGGLSVVFLLSETDMTWNPFMVLGWGHAGPPSDFITSAHMYRMPGMRRALGSACACGPVPYLTYCLISLRPKLWADFNPVGENVIFFHP